MDPVVVVHVVLAAGLILLAAVVGVWGLARSGRIASDARPRESRAFAHALQLSHTLVVATGLIGLGLLAEGHRSGDPLHARVYGPFMVVAIVAAYGFRSPDPRTNVRVFAVCALAILALGLRAALTG